MRIAVVRAGALGDFLLGLPALRALRAAYPGADVHLVGPLPQAELALQARVANAVTGVDEPRLARLFDAGLRPADAPPWLRDLDLAVVWLRRPEAVAANLAGLGARQVVAAAPFPPPPLRRHVADWLIDSLRPAGVPAPAGWDGAPWLVPDDEARQWAERWVQAHPAARRYAVLHPGSGSARKNWPAANWVRALDTLTRTRGLPLVVTAGAADESALAAFSRAASASGGPADRGVILENAPLPRLAALLASAALYCGNDSGVTHLAAATGAPALAVFGPTDPAIWRPRGPRVRVVGGAPAAPDGAGSLIGDRAAWPGVDQVVAAAHELLADTPSARADW